MVISLGKYAGVIEYGNVEFNYLKTTKRQLIGGLFY